MNDSMEVPFVTSRIRPIRELHATGATAVGRWHRATHAATAIGPLPIIRTVIVAEIVEQIGGQHAHGIHVAQTECVENLRGIVRRVIVVVVIVVMVVHVASPPRRRLHKLSLLQLIVVLPLLVIVSASHAEELRRIQFHVDRHRPRVLVIFRLVVGLLMGEKE